MRRLAAISAALAGIAAYLAFPVLAASPPDPRDPCSDHGRNTCGTLGVGFYKTVAGGPRWYGDFRGAVPGEPHTFCIDAHFWYASPSYRYQEVPAVGLHNRDGAAVSLESQERMAYAIWRFGRSASADQQAAVMLYTHSLVGDSASGTLDPATVSAAVASKVAGMARAAERYHGPYRVDVQFPAALRVGKPATAAVRIVAASGAALPDTPLTVAGEGARTLSQRTRTGKSGVAHVTLVPERTSGVRLRVTTQRLASNRPRIYAGTTSAAAANAQRLAAPSSQQVSTTVPVRGVTAAPRVVTQASAQRAAPGARVSDRVVVTGLGDMQAQIRAELWGPYASAAAPTCTGTPHWQGSLTASGDGTSETPTVRLDRAGYYTFRESIATRPGVIGFTAPCGEAAETVLVSATPKLTTVVSQDVITPGSRLSDTVRVHGLGRTPATIEVELFGPFASRRQIDCTGRPAWTGRMTVAGDGTYRSPAVIVRRAGVYSFRERLIGSEAIAPVTTPCADVAETALAAPEILTGRGDAAGSGRTAATGRPPVRVRIPELGIDATVVAVGVDVARGVLAIPSDIQRVGWWRDGSRPGASTGTTLIAGHVDDANGGIGSFFSLHRARPGSTIELVSGGSRISRYRVVSVRIYPKRRLPLAIFSRAGAARLVLVTCGGTFDRASGHYPDNVVVTAVPV